MSLNLINQKVRPIYNCIEVELYSLGDKMTNYCKTNINDFNNFSTRFTIQYCDDVINLFKTAEEMPDAIIRSSQHEEKRILIIPQANLCLGLCKELKFHITKGYTKDYWNTMYKDAGFAAYRKASNDNWDILINMLNNMKSFIVNNSAKLTAGGMPANFSTNFNSQLEVLRPLIADFINAENNAREKRNDKITADNTAYTELKSIASAGKIIYRNNQSKRILFTISKQLELISGVGSHWRKFSIEANGFKTIKKVVRNSYFKNIGVVQVLICEGNDKCTTGITVEPGETIKLAFEQTTITVNNTSADKKAKFMCRCVKK